MVPAIKVFRFLDKVVHALIVSSQIQMERIFKYLCEWLLLLFVSLSIKQYNYIVDPLLFQEPFSRSCKFSGTGLVARKVVKAHSAA
jgi:hypothetical protein